MLNVNLSAKPMLNVNLSVKPMLNVKLENCKAGARTRPVTVLLYFAIGLSSAVTHLPVVPPVRRHAHAHVNKCV